MGDIMRMLGNILWWFPFFGFVNAIAAYLLGVIFFITIIGAPIGLGLFQLGNFYLAPFGRALIPAKHLGEQTGARSAWNVVATILWIPFGIILAVTTALQIAALFITLIGIPVGIALAKAFATIFNPVGKVCRPVEVRDELARRRAVEILERSARAS